MNIAFVLKAVRSHSTWYGALDILLVAYILYRLLLLVRGTRALQILGGLATLLAALYLSSHLHLDTLNWLLRQVVPLGPVAIVILFYPELRHALEEFGPRFWSRGLSLLTREDVTAVIDATVNAAIFLSAQRMGALIVFERQTGLDEVAASGAPMDAIVSDQLLESLFYKGGALHDGAALIRKGRIVAAGCLLPLTDRLNIDATVHTRHKAAIGMSENSDAVVIVVSEETGTISLSVEGKIVRGLNRDTLRERLHRLMQNGDRMPGLRRSTK